MTAVMDTTTDTTTDTTIDPLAAAKSLVATVRARAGEIEKARSLPADLARQFAEAGLYRLCVPRAYGGLEVHPAVMSEVLEIVAGADASAGWCLMIGVTTAVTAAYLDADTALEIYGGDETVITGGVFAPKGKAIRVDDDSYRLSGRWQWASGSLNCTWLMGGALIYRGDTLERLPGGRPDSRMLILPASDVEIIDTWHTVGLCGTGSHDFVVTDKLVPRRRSVSFTSDPVVIDSALYRFPVFGFLAIGIASVALGCARAAIDAFVELAAAKVPQGGSKPLALRSSIAATVARAHAAVGSARAYLRDSIARAWDSANRDGDIPLEDRLELRIACCNSAKQAAEAVKLVYTAAGGSSVFLTSPLQRQFRDVHVATQHLMVSDTIMEAAGRGLLGAELDPTFI